jgi:hypothetical protein
VSSSWNEFIDKGIDQKNSWEEKGQNFRENIKTFGKKIIFKMKSSDA